MKEMKIVVVVLVLYVAAMWVGVLKLTHGYQRNAFLVEASQAMLIR